MPDWTTADYVIYAVAAYVAVMAFLKLFAARRATLLAQLEADIAKEQAKTKPS
ncbi:MAG: hypothetical protein QM811_18360 [Pirellulales bacterium]